MECILNLTQSPAAARMFFCVGDGDAGSSQDTSIVPASPSMPNNAYTSAAMNTDKTAARTRLTLLLALTNSSTRGTALAAAAALSHILSFEAGAASFSASAAFHPSPGSTGATSATAPARVDDRTPIRRLLTLVAESAGLAADLTNQDLHSHVDREMFARAATALCAFIDAGNTAVRTGVRDLGGKRLLELLVRMKPVEEMGLSVMIGNAIVTLKDDTDS